MPIRSTVNQTVQFGVETTLGTDVAANKKLPDVMVTPRPMANVLAFRSAASKYASSVGLGREWSESTVTGAPGYQSIVYPLNSVITTGVISTPGGGTNSRDHTFTPLTTGADTPKSFTIEKGDATNAEQIVGAVFNEFGLKVTRNELTTSGRIVGQQWTTTTMTGSPTTIAMVPMFPSQFDIYNDTTYGGLGTTKLTSDFEAEFTIADRYFQTWPINSAKASWDQLGEAVPNVRMAITVQADATGQAFVTAMRNSTTQYVRLEGLGTIIEAAIKYKFRVDFVGKVIEAPDLDDFEGAYVLKVVMGAFDDGTNPPYKVVVTNTLTAL